MNTINMSTGFTPFMLKSAHSPCLIPPLLNLKAHCVITQLAEDLLDTQDSLTAAKISQACQANKDRSPD
ncbi:hypothetical protein L208DRAFT_1338269 [Tricholoma matsutake]|nr:hypothetical protein L208DRAFT_1338269 [Tricholoma matsutake 945]